MPKSFPTSWPYSNSSGITFSKEEVSSLAKTLLAKFKPRSYEFGVEMSMLLLWLLDHVVYKETMENLGTVLFARVIRRKTFTERHAGGYISVGFEVVEEAVDSGADLVELKHMFDKLTSGEITIDDILRLDREDRKYLVRKLKKKARRLLDANRD